MALSSATALLPYTTMYQAASKVITRLSRSAGPVCRTRLAMRPAKSFWKNVQLCRTTCQWFCQRIMFDRPGLTTWLIMTFCQNIAAGRASSSTAAITASCAQASRHSVPGACVETSDTTRPMNAGIEASSTAITPPPRNRPAVSQRACRM